MVWVHLLGHLQNVASDQGLHHLLKIRNLRVKQNSLHSRPFSQHTLDNLPISAVSALILPWHLVGCFRVERCGAVVKHRTRDREVPGSIPTNCKCCFLEQETLSTLLSAGFYPGKKRATWKISTRLLNVLPSINKVDYYYYYYYS